MNILFIGTTGIHHTLLAAHIYLRQTNGKDYSQLKFWGDWSREALGLPLFVNYDDEGNKVYVLGVGWDVLMAQKTLQQLHKILNSDRQDLIVAPVLVKRERLLLFLHRLGRWQHLNKLAQLMITGLLHREYITIQKQMEEFTQRIRSG